MSLSKQSSSSRLYAKTPCKCKSHTKKTAETSKLKEREYIYVLKMKRDHRNSKTLIIEFPWIGPYILEKALSNNSYLVRKIGTHKPQVLHRIKLKTSTVKQPKPDVHKTSQKWKLEPEVIIKQDHFLAEHGSLILESPILTPIEMKQAHQPT